MTKSKPPSGVLERGLYLLEFFTRERPRLQLRELAALSGLDKATILRALKTLVNYGWLEKGADGLYSPGATSLRLAGLFSATSTLVSRLEGPIQQITVRTEQTTSFFIRANDQRVCLVRDQTHRDFRYFVEPGASVAINRGGAAAKVLTAYLDPAPEEAEGSEIRRQGYYVSRGERHRFFVSIGLPVFNEQLVFVGAIAITGLSEELSDEDLRRFAAVTEEELSTAGLTSRNTE